MAANHLKQDASQRLLDVAFGRLPVSGDLCWSKSDGSYVYFYNALGEGEWKEIEAVFWKGKKLASTEWTAHLGAFATAMMTGPQTVSPYFSKDVPHSRTTGISCRVPIALADADTLNNPPDRMELIAKTKKSADYNSSGVQTDYDYFLNPANQIIQVLLDYARLPFVPPIYASLAEFWLSRIDFGNWTEFRDFHNDAETVDYRTMPDVQGFGLRVQFYAGANFDTFKESFVQQNLDIDAASQPPTVLTDSPFSAKFEGYIKFQYSETYTIYITHDNGARLILNGSMIIGTAGSTTTTWNDNGLSATGTHSGTYAATADAFTPIRLDWNDGGLPANLKVEWESASQTREVIPIKFLYPIAESRPRYQSHIWFNRAVSPAFAISEILRICNSVKQDTANGKLRFFGLETLEPSFSFSGVNILENSFRAQPPSLIENSPVTEFRAVMRDADRRFIETPEVAISHFPDAPDARTQEVVQEVNCYAMTRWQAYKVLAMTAKLQAEKGLKYEFEAFENKSAQVCENDLVTVRHRKTGDVEQTYLIKRAVDLSVDPSRSNESGSQPARRRFTAQRWRTE